jgi:CBS domain-containing protein
MAERADTGDVLLFLHHVRDLVGRPPVTCAPTASARSIAEQMSRERVGSVVVVGAEGAPVGIVTDRDLRQKVVAGGRDPAATPASAIMSTPLVTTRLAAFAFEAVLEMTRRAIHHLVVVEDGRAVGVVSSHDLLALQTAHPVMLARDIVSAPSPAALAQLGARVTALVRRLVAEGGSPHDIGRIVAELNDRIVSRLLRLTAAALEEAGQGPPPGPGCWLAFGSEARREQTLRTDQDNGLVYADPPPDARESVAAWWGNFAGRAIAGLIAIGFPPCPGNAMASNPTWCQPQSVWAGSFRRWIDHPSPEEVLAASIYFDLRPVAGALDLGTALSAVIRDEAPMSRVFLGLLARDVATRRVPLTMFGNIGVAARGPHRGAVDVKGAGSLQLVGAGRLAVLELGVTETNTVERFRAASAHALYTAAETREITDAYQHLMRLRLVHQLEQIDAGVPLDNHVAPSRLSHADALLFRDALKTVERVQAGIRARFATDLLG